MTNENDFLDAIRADPDDNPLRLVYADWLEERGDVKRAEFLRLHTELGMRTSPNPSCPIRKRLDQLRKNMPAAWVASLYCFENQSLIDRLIKSAMGNFWKIGFAAYVDNVPAEMVDNEFSSTFEDVVGWRPIPSVVTDEELDDLEARYQVRYPRLYRMFLKAVHFVEFIECGFQHHMHLPGNWVAALEHRLDFAGGLPQAGYLPLGFCCEYGRDVHLLCFDTKNASSTGDVPIVGNRGVRPDGSATLSVHNGFRPIWSSCTAMFRCLTFAADTDLYFTHLAANEKRPLKKMHALRQFLAIDPDGAGSGEAREFWTQGGKLEFKTI